MIEIFGYQLYNYINFQKICYSMKHYRDEVWSKQ